MVARPIEIGASRTAPSAVHFAREKWIDGIHQLLDILPNRRSDLQGGVADAEVGEELGKWLRISSAEIVSKNIGFPSQMTDGDFSVR